MPSKIFPLLLALVFLLTPMALANDHLVGTGCTMWPYPNHKFPGYNPRVTADFIVWDTVTQRYNQMFCQIPTSPDPNVYGRTLYVNDPTSIYPGMLTGFLNTKSVSQTKWRKITHRLPYKEAEFWATCFWYGTCPP